MSLALNKRASGKGGIAILFHAGRACPALPEPGVRQHHEPRRILQFLAGCRGYRVFQSHREPNAAFDQIAGLLVRRGMARQDSALAQAKLGQQRFLAVNQCLPLDPVQGRTVSAATSLLEHA